MVLGQMKQGSDAAWWRKQKEEGGRAVVVDLQVSEAAMAA
jgi:hypothetical protein